MMEALFWYSAPFLGLGILYILWAWLTSKTEHKYPRYYKFAQKLNDSLPQISVYLIIILFVYFYFNS